MVVCQKNGMVLPSSAQTTFQADQIAHPRFYAAVEELEPVEKVQYDDKGKTLPVSKKSLEADAKRKNFSHSDVLGKNMIAAGQVKPRGQVDAHHIVSARAKGAAPSRIRLYGWGIGIDDVDNGVFLPRNKKVAVIDRRLKSATRHSVVHTAVYHLAVFNELRQASPSDSDAGRGKLRDIKQDLVFGTFPYRKDDRP
ncbi:AHH domain-containing protein [Dyella acidisoli]